MYVLDLAAADLYSSWYGSCTRSSSWRVVSMQTEMAPFFSGLA